MFRPAPAAPSGRPAACGVATTSAGASTARETRARRGWILALGEHRLQLPLNVAGCGCRVRASARAHDRLIARGGDDLIGADVAVAFGGGGIDRRAASD